MDSTQWFSLFLRFVLTLLSDAKFREEFGLGTFAQFLSEQCSEGVVASKDAEELEKRVRRFLS